ncbi:hypothetical protein [Xanthomonas phage XPP1]|uniref:Uncharacterized protein n=1 Tax=Xanthomonas phage XPP1 TaxID=2099853 RepID=A0A3S7HHF6_9CAUD|nr:hypothetical protein KEM11_gp03 [Xanthomonas phage XPP1]AVO23645.1 hypothetical protein [Xanthomonas phage XPP1]AVO24045.1 hypothetical protein [Xanthomonas phage XPP8]
MFSCVSARTLAYGLQFSIRRVGKALIVRTAVIVSLHCLRPLSSRAV